MMHDHEKSDPAIGFLQNFLESHPLFSPLVLFRLWHLSYERAYTDSAGRCVKIGRRRPKAAVERLNFSATLPLLAGGLRVWQAARLARTSRFLPSC